VRVCRVHRACACIRKEDLSADVWACRQYLECLYSCQARPKILFMPVLPKMIIDRCKHWQASIHIHAYIHAHTRTHTNTHKRTHIRTHTYSRCPNTYKHGHTTTHTRTHTLTHTHDAHTSGGHATFAVAQALQSLSESSLPGMRQLGRTTVHWQGGWEEGERLPQG